MRKGLWRKVGIATCLAVLALIVGSVSVLAVANYTVQKQSTVTVIAEAPAKFTVWWDVEGTQPVSTIPWPVDMTPGSSEYVTVYLRNDCSVPIDINVTSTLQAVYGAVTAAPFFVSEGDPPEPMKLTLTLTTAIPVGARSFVIKFTASEKP